MKLHVYVHNENEWIGAGIVVDWPVIPRVGELMDLTDKQDEELDRLNIEAMKKDDSLKRGYKGYFYFNSSPENECNYEHFSLDGADTVKIVQHALFANEIRVILE